MAKKTIEIEKGVPKNVTRPLVPYHFAGTAKRGSVVIHAVSPEEAEEKFLKKHGQKKESKSKN